MYNIYDLEQRCNVYLGFNTVLQARDFIDKMELDPERWIIKEGEKNE